MFKPNNSIEYRFYINSIPSCTLKCGQWHYWNWLPTIVTLVQLVLQYLINYINTHLQIVSPLSLSFQQSIKDWPTGLMSSGIIATDHIVRGAHPLKELSIHILGIAVIRDVNQIHVHGRTVGQSCPTWYLSTASTWKKQTYTLNTSKLCKTDMWYNWC